MTRRPLLINGFMATGKSTLARQVAERTGNPFVDLDGRLVRRTGSSIPEYFRQHGEEAFRSLEREELLRLLDEWPSEFARAPVCAVGGGALVHRPTRLHALRKGVVVTLDAELEVILQRAGTQGGRPLLDGPSPELRAAQLLERRAVSYQEANTILRSDTLSVAELTEQAIEVWRRDSLTVAAAERSYVVEVGEGRLDECVPGLLANASRVLLVTDSTVDGLYAGRLERALAQHGVHAARVVLPPGERAKNLDSIRRIYDAALEHGLDRRAMLLALGGGVVTDMTGFAAATWLRGVRWVGAASTLLAMVDASVGGKTGVDFGPAKNSVGAFWQPSGVVCDTGLVATESERAYRGALSEVVKTALIGDPQLFELMEANCDAILRRDAGVVTELVHRCVALKAWVVASDERESGIRAWLNLGHTVGHALEAQGGYERLTHGEAVSLGLVAALRIGSHLGHTPPELVERTTNLLKRLGLPSAIEAEPLSEAAGFLALDKKRAGSKIRFVVARGVGDVTLVPLEVKEVERHVRALRS